VALVVRDQHLTTERPLPHHWEITTSPLRDQHPTTERPLPHHWETTTSPLRDHYLTTERPLPHHWGITISPLRDHYLTTERPLPHYWETTTSPLRDHYLTTRAQLWLKCCSSRLAARKPAVSCSNFFRYGLNTARESRNRGGTGKPSLTAICQPCR